MKNMQKILTGLLSLALIATMAVPTFAYELTQADIEAGVNTSTGMLKDGVTQYNTYESTGATSAAGKASTVVEVNASATILKLTIPVRERLSLDSNGVITTPDSCDATSKGLSMIKNRSPLGQIRVTDCKIVNANTWTISAFDSDFKNIDVNTKTYGFKINGLAVPTNGVVMANNVATDTVTSTFDIAKGEALVEEFGDYTFTYSLGESHSAFPIIANGACLPIVYEGKLPGMSSALLDVQVGGVIYNIDFVKAA
ncbi:MAG: hypothetical protein RR313_00115 [Anaerovoracaceae bacterium]